MATKADSRTSSITFDFYRLGGKDAPRLIGLIGRAFDPDDTAARMVPLDDDWLRLEQWRVRDAVGYGLLVRLKVGKRPTVASRSRDGVRGITLAEGEELAETLCFSYRPQHGVLILQRNLDAGGISNLCWYIDRLCQGAAIEPVHITSLADRPIEDIGRIRSATFKFKVDVPKNLGLFDSQNPTIGSVIRLGNEAQAREVTVKLSAVNAKQSLLPKAIEGWRETLLHMSGKPEIARLVVDNDLADRTTINLLEHQMAEKATVAREPSVDELYSALDEVFSRREGEIEHRNSLAAKGV